MNLDNKVLKCSRPSVPTSSHVLGCFDTFCQFHLSWDWWSLPMCGCNVVAVLIAYHSTGLAYPITIIGWGAFLFCFFTLLSQQNSHNNEVSEIAFSVQLFCKVQIISHTLGASLFLFLFVLLLCDICCWTTDTSGKIFTSPTQELPCWRRKETCSASGWSNNFPFWNFMIIKLDIFIFILFFTPFTVFINCIKLNYVWWWIQEL